MPMRAVRSDVTPNGAMTREPRHAGWRSAWPPPAAPRPVRSQITIKTPTEGSDAARARRPPAAVVPASEAGAPPQPPATNDRRRGVVPTSDEPYGSRRCPHGSWLELPAEATPFREDPNVCPLARDGEALRTRTGARDATAVKRAQAHGGHVDGTEWRPGNRGGARPYSTREPTSTRCSKRALVEQGGQRAPAEASSAEGPPYELTTGPRDPGRRGEVSLWTRTCRHRARPGDGIDRSDADGTCWRASSRSPRRPFRLRDWAGLFAVRIGERHRTADKGADANRHLAERAARRAASAARALRDRDAAVRRARRPGGMPRTATRRMEGMRRA